MANKHFNSEDERIFEGLFEIELKYLVKDLRDYKKTIIQVIKDRDHSRRLDWGEFAEEAFFIKVKSLLKDYEQPKQLLRQSEQILTDTEE